jgi:hypothetical protein
MAIIKKTTAKSDKYAIISPQIGKMVQIYIYEEIDAGQMVKNIYIM